MTFFKKNVTFLHKYLVQDTKNSLSEKNRIPAAYFPCTCNRKHIIFDLGNRHLQSIIARLLLIIIAHLLLSIIARTYCSIVAGPRIRADPPEGGRHSVIRPESLARSYVAEVAWLHRR